LTRADRRRVDGVLLLDKAIGITSNTALMRAKRLFNAEKAGHTGTLDPLASGLLPICFGEATKFSQFLLDAVKGYRATIRFGVTTTTQDVEGDVVATRAVAIDRAAIEAVLVKFTGRIRQIPPAFSALKHRGRPHYEYARAGIDVPRPPRDVHILSLTLAEWSPPIAVVDVECSKGTYVRTLAADIGETLGCGAHLAGLRRVAAGGFSVQDAVTLDDIESLSIDARDRALLPVDAMLRALPMIRVDAAGAMHLRQGRAVAQAASADALMRAYDSENMLVGVVRAEAGSLVPVRLVSTS
jgi:tRNA pseudouridine55 synthase